MTDLDALMGRLRDRNADIDLRFRAEIIQTIEALRARLAPTHADDEALLVGVTEAVRDMDDEGYNAAMDRVARRLADLRARAEAAEAALAECRAKIARITTEPYHTVHRDFIKPEYFTPGHALKTKEPRT